MNTSSFAHAVPAIWRWRQALAALGLSMLVACGGGGGTAGDPGTANPEPAGGGASPTLTLDAQGSSAYTASLSWAPVAGASGYTLERRSANSAWAAVATFGPADRQYVDEGLARTTGYTYRLAALGIPAAPVEKDVTTTDDEPVITPVATQVAGAAASAEIGADGGNVAVSTMAACA